MITLVEQLGAMNITSVLIEGGGRVIASALNSGIVDKIAFFYAPKILGGDDGIPICRGEGPAAMKDCIRLNDISVQRFGDDVMIEGYVEKT
jgi:diaminohydroxyphosphoribosylaminopyrimidine deaminase/5-amino-6-(5-phosphoribosylamino)uracil reductase